MGFLLLAAGLWLAWEASTTDHEGPARGSSVEGVGAPRAISSRDRVNRDESDTTRRPKLSEEELTQLKRELEEHSAACTGWISPEFQSFIDQLLNELQFSPEMLEVLNLLEDFKYSSAKRGVHKALKKLL